MVFPLVEKNSIAKAVEFFTKAFIALDFILKSNDLIGHYNINGFSAG